MKKGEIYEGIIEKVEFPNKGFVWVDDQKVIVKNGIPGQKVRFMINKKRSGRAEGRLLEIVEKHHRLKLDAPSGTALALADSINEAMDNQYHYVYDRSQKREKRDDKEIGISAVRGGTIVGEHEIIFAGQDEVIEFKHTAYSKAIFGKGAVEAAKFLAGKPAGRYDMSDVIG